MVTRQFLSKPIIRLPFTVPQFSRDVVDINFLVFSETMQSKL